MSSEVTITLLPVSLSLVHIPRSRVSHVSHPILRQILHPNPGFLNITCNDIELSIFAEDHMLEDFEPLARKDRRRQRSRSGSNQSKNGLEFQPVEVSYERWSVLQIDSHSNQIDNSGARVHELSAPLAAAGISILYQSSYMSDFIFVKEARIQDVLNLFSKAGFDLYSSDSGLLNSAPLSRPDSPSSDTLPPLFDNTHLVSAVLTRSASAKDVSVPRSEADSMTPTSRNKSHSPTLSEVRILEPDLACVGLSDEFGVDHWGLKIVKLVAFPDLIPSTSRRSSQNSSVTDCSSQSAPHSSLYGSLEYIKMDRPFTPSSSFPSESDDDGYYSHSPRNASPVSMTPAGSRSQADLHGSTLLHSPLQTPSRHHISPYGQPFTTPSTGRRSSPTRQPPPQPTPLSFFSFTRTPEGSSLTADVRVLATLFPPHERHMVICGGELDAADERLGGYASDDEEGEPDPYSSSTQKCLQIDLRRFGLGS
ncbi:hypothetical protein CC2G_010237 [Coprinopsis cinerea AmutBmut pab1-1]|nr:hypothetical protein CC2G_010237 [Coprinopsis cinerea AmutBmut pab1-1]